MKSKYFGRTPISQLDHFNWQSDLFFPSHFCTTFTPLIDKQPSHNFFHSGWLLCVWLLAESITISVRLCMPHGAQYVGILSGAHTSSPSHLRIRRANNEYRKSDVYLVTCKAIENCVFCWFSCARIQQQMAAKLNKSISEPIHVWACNRKIHRN